MRTWRSIGALGLTALWLHAGGCATGKYVSPYELERIARADHVIVTTKDRDEIVLTRARVGEERLVGFDGEDELRSFSLGEIASVYASERSDARLAVILVAVGLLATAIGVGAALLAGVEDDYYGY